MQRSYIDYAMSVIVGRALPAVRDGLKPVHTRILYAMYDGGFRPDRGFFKCSRVVGDVMGNYHPHGDSAIYDALVRMAQPWSMRMPLIDSQGNFGSPGNDPPAAMRYTECRLAPLAMEMLRDINEDTVDFRENYDGRSREPVVLPARFPNLLINGSEGIAVVRDESSGRTGQRLVIVLKRDAIAKVVLNNLYKHTQLQDTFGANMLALVDGVPRTLRLDQMIRYWVTHQIEVIVRRTKFRLRNAAERLHSVAALPEASDRAAEG